MCYQTILLLTSLTVRLEETCFIPISRSLLSHKNNNNQFLVMHCMKNVISFHLLIKPPPVLALLTVSNIMYRWLHNYKVNIHEVTLPIKEMEYCQPPKSPRNKNTVLTLEVTVLLFIILPSVYIFPNNMVFHFWTFHKWSHEVYFSLHLYFFI